MSSPLYAALAARLLRRAPPASQPSAAAQQRALITIELALAARARKQRLRRVAAAVALVAASVLATFGVRSLSPSSDAASEAGAKVSVSALQSVGASIVDSTRHRAVLTTGTELATGSRIETTVDGGAALRLSTGTELELDGKSRLALLTQGKFQRFALTVGGLQAKVAKLAPGDRFVVDTPDAQVEVRGTRFHLNVLDAPEACQPEIKTRLAVQEGLVEVRWSGHVAQIGAGQMWPEECAAAAVDAAKTHAALPAPHALRAKAALTLGARTAPAGPQASTSMAGRDRGPSALGAQTELFADAARAARGGDISAALAMYEQLIQTHPSSALAENAVAERMRLLGATSPVAARREAARYLARYPGGFGKREAERILANP